MRLARSHHVQPNPRPVLLFSVRTLLQETLALHGPARVSDLRDEQAAAGAHRGEPAGRNRYTVPLRSRYRQEGGGLERRDEMPVLDRKMSSEGSVRMYGRKDKVPNIPEVKVNRLRSVVCKKYASSQVISCSPKI